MSQRSGRPTPISAVVAIGFLLGAGVFGLYRGMNAEPLPDPVLPPISGGDVPAQPAADPLPLPAMPVIPSQPPAQPPAASLPPLEPASGLVPPAVPPERSQPVDPIALPPAANTTPSLPPPAGVPVNPATPPADTPLPPPTPVDTIPLPGPKLDPLPPPSTSPQEQPFPKSEPTTTLPLIDQPAEKVLPPAALPRLQDQAPAAAATPTVNLGAIDPTEPAQPMKPADRPAGVGEVTGRAVDPTEPAQPMKPDFRLRPEQAPLNVNLKDVAPNSAELVKPEVGPAETLPRMREVEQIPAPRTVIERPTSTTLSAAPGDAPMLTRQMMLPAVLGAALAATTVPSGTVSAADEPATPTAVDAKFAAMQKTIDGLVEDMKLMKTKKEQLELQLYGRTDGKAAVTPSDLGVIKRLELAEADLKKMGEQVKDLESKLATQTTVAKSPIPSALIGKGKVVLVNEFRTKLSIMVNGKSYPLDINEVKEVLVEPGEFSYELIEFPNATPVKSTIKDSETVTLRIK